MKKELLAPILALGSIFAIAAPVSAHLQAGPAYLLINGKFADTAPVVSSRILVAQDLVKDSVLVGSRVDLAVELGNIILPPTVLASAKWRTNWELNGPWEEGETAKHVYNKPGSYFITVQESDSLTKGFQNYDLAQINAVPKLPYDLPNADVTATSSKNEQDSLKVSFSSTVAIDESTSLKEVRWDFGDTTQATGQKAEHTYKPFSDSEFVTVRVTDGNGILNDISWKLDQDGNLSKVGKNYIQGTAKVQSSDNLTLVIGVAIAVTLVFFSGIFFLWKLRLKDKTRLED